MTTHLHPDLLPVEATPFWNDYSWIHENHGYEMFSKSHAVILERRARKAEAQLAIAMKFINWIVDPELRGWSDEIEFAEEIIAEIKAIEGGE